MVVLDSQIETAMEIQSISWMYMEIEPYATCEGFTMYLGYCADDTLDLDFDSNWIPGTKTLVYSADPLEITTSGPGQWVTLELDQPFWYNGEDNLLIDCQWNNAAGDNSFYTAHWISGDNTMVYEHNTPGYVHARTPLVPYMTLSGSLGFESETFGGIKVLLGQ